MRRFLGVLLVFFLFGSRAAGQSACRALQVPTPEPSKILFTPQQEMELGEIVRQQMEREFQVIEDPQEVEYLRRIGDRVARQLPDIGLRYEFLLYDLPQIQAFGMPGGRVYVSRKMVVYLRTEDELAGMLGHELGHLIARQQAVSMSRNFREVLGIKSIAPDEDLPALYNQLVDTAGMKRYRSRNEEDRNQEIADQLGLQAAVRAGYAPQAFPDLLDRLMQTKGATGN